MRLLGDGLDVLVEIPHRLQEVVIRLRQHALVLHALDECLELRVIEVAELVLLAPTTTEQQLAVVAGVTSVQQGAEQFSLANSRVASAERVVEFRCRNRAFWHLQVDHQVAEPLHVLVAASRELVNGVEHGAHQVVRERAHG